MNSKERILKLLEVSDRPLSGYEIAMITRCRAWALYPALRALEESGAIESEWIEGPYPRRRAYRVRENR